MRFLWIMFFFCWAMVLWKLAPIVMVIWWVCANPWWAGGIFVTGLTWGLLIVPAIHRARSSTITRQPEVDKGLEEMAAYHNQGKRK